MWFKKKKLFIPKKLVWCWTLVFGLVTIGIWNQEAQSLPFHEDKSALFGWNFNGKEGYSEFDDDAFLSFAAKNIFELTNQSLAYSFECQERQIKIKYYFLVTLNNNIHKCLLLELRIHQNYYFFFFENIIFSDKKKRTKIRNIHFLEIHSFLPNIYFSSAPSLFLLAERKN